MSSMSGSRSNLAAGVPKVENFEEDFYG